MVDLGVTILVLDDDPDVLEAVTMLLELRFGRCARVVSALDGARALGLALAVHPDLVICDYSMPMMDGPTFVRRARGEGALRNVPILILSGEPGLAELTRELDVQAYVCKSAVEELLSVAGHLLPDTCAQAAGCAQAFRA